MQALSVKTVVFTASCVRSACGPTVADLIASAVQKFLSEGARHAVLIEDTSCSLADHIATRLDTCSQTNLIVCNRVGEHWRVGIASRDTSPVDVPTLDAAFAILHARWGITPDRTATVAADEAGLSLCQFSRIHFHVGDASCLKRKYRGLVPLSGQWACGLANILRHFAAAQQDEPTIDHGDIVAFAELSYRFYASAASPAVMLDKARRAAATLAERFPKILAIFGSGYPFYLTDGDLAAPLDRTPDSILRYLDEQRSYFARKVMPKDVYNVAQTRVFTKSELGDRMNLSVDRNQFDEYEYEKCGVKPPLPAADGLTLEEYVRDNWLDIESDLWPCHHCSVLQDADKYPDQLVTKEFSLSCLACHQTSLLPRNVTGCSSDVDLIVFVDGEVEAHAQEMKNFLAAHSEFYIYDTNFVRMFVGNNGPVDLFVADVGGFWRSLDTLVQGDWMCATVSSLAVWLPVTPHELELGSHFALCFEPLAFSSTAVQNRFESYRQRYARKVSSEEAVRRMRNASYYHQQLLGNPQIRNMIARKLATWCRDREAAI